MTTLLKLRQKKMPILKDLFFYISIKAALYVTFSNFVIQLLNDSESQKKVLIQSDLHIIFF